MARLGNRIALVTGGGAGLGKADSFALAQEGAIVYVTDIDEEAAKAVAAEICAEHGQVAKAMHHDVGSVDDWKRVYADIEAEHGRLDILVNNAGLVIVADPEETTLEQFEKVMHVMCTGVFLGCKYGLPLLAKSKSGSIINMSSVASHAGLPSVYSYSAAKGAVRSMTKSIAIHCQEKGYKVRCNSLHPSGVETPMVQAFENRVGQEQVIPEGVLPFGHNGAPSDVANFVVFLASDETRFVTGAEILIDNGRMIRV